MSLLSKINELFGNDSAFNLDGSVVAYDELEPWAYAGQTNYAPVDHSLYDGGKFAGGFGDTQIQDLDYWTLRARSSQLFNENLYARGIIRRLITNEVNSGLSPEASPDEQVLGLPEDSLNDWTEIVENRFALWGKSPEACDWKRENTFGAIMRAARMEALIAGDVLVVMRQNPRTKLPAVQLVSGNAIRTPFGSGANIRRGHKVKHGVEFDAAERQVAYHVQQTDGSFRRLPARGEKSGRRIAWMLYGTEKRLDEVRGQPILAIVLQSLKEIDRYRDSVQRKAVVNSILAMFIKKTSDKIGSLPMQHSATRRDQASITDGATGSTPRKFNLASYLPGVVIDELQEGEEPVMKGGEGTDVNFATFEEAITAAVAWGLELPPEILRLSFSNNYSASQAAINEFKIYLSRKWVELGEEFCAHIYKQWLVGQVLLGKIAAPGLLEAWRDPAQHDVLAAWVSVDWYGSIKPSTDMLKQVKASELLVEGGYSTRAREARVMTGTKYSKNIKRLRRENEQLAEAVRPLLELKAEFGTAADDAVLSAEAEASFSVLDEQLQEYIENDHY